MPDESSTAPLWTCEIGEEEEGDRLDRFLGGQLHPEYSRSYLAGLIRDQRIEVNGAPCKPAYRLEAGDRIEADLGPSPSQAPEPEEMDLSVIYEDDHVLVIDKPAGLLVHPTGPRGKGTMVNGLLARYPEIERVGVVLRPGIVHRLDRFTSGVLVVARSNTARVGLVDQFKQRLVKKEYITLVEGKLTLDSDYIDLPIGDHPKFRSRMKIDLEEGKPASTFYELTERFAAFSLLKVSPITGRTHQIRVHLSHLDHPVVCDGIYGRQHSHAFRTLCERREAAGLSRPKLQRQALHAGRLRFTHPVDGRQMDFESPLPEDMDELVRILRSEASEASEA